MEKNNKSTMPFEKENYVLMLIGIAIIAIGFVIMASDKEEFGFGFLGLTLAPIVVVSGFIFEIFAILYKPKKK
jgi:hypothetical protein